METVRSVNNFNLLQPIDTPDIEYGDRSYVFSLFQDDEFSNFDAPELQTLEIIDYKLCPDCNVKMQPMKTSYQCLQCGRDKKILENNSGYTPNIMGNYNTSESCSLPLKIVGVDSYRYNKALMRTSSNYVKVLLYTTNKQLTHQNTLNQRKQLPVTILREAAEMYGKVQALKIVRRGDGRKGALGACIYFACCADNITKKPKEIAKFMGVDESYLSNGDKLLRKLHSQGLINIPAYHDPTVAYLSQYFQALRIDGKYKEFVMELLEVSTSQKMRGENNSRISTKCAGLMYVLKTQMELNITDADIVRCCDIVKSTFIKYYKYLVSNRSLLKPVFKKYSIPPLRKKVKKDKKVAKKVAIQAALPTPNGVIPNIPQ